MGVFEAKDVAGERFRPGGGTPSPRECAAKLAASWVAWAGWPVCVTCDPGVHNWGVFAQVLSAHGVALRTAGGASVTAA